MMNLTTEKNNDIAKIRTVLIDAFGRENEGVLVEKIRNSPNFISELSLVAKEDENILGYILFSPITIATETQITKAIALAPLAVKPAYQNQGIGSNLVKFGLERCRELNHNIIVVLGEPEYYERFGFQTASKFNIFAPFPVPDEAFMIIHLISDQLLHNISGTVQYPAYFNEV
ncbi:MAG TPA: N-acetyltransferase [Allocoleopsis sp.]